MFVAIEHSVDLLECSCLYIFMPVALLKQLFRILYNLDRGGPQRTRLHLDVGRVKTVGSSDLAKIVRLCLTTFGDNQDAVIACAPPLLTFKLFFFVALLGSCRAPLAYSPKVGFQKGDATVTPHQVTTLKRLVFAWAKFRQADQRRCLIALFFDKPDLIAPKQIDRV